MRGFVNFCQKSRYMKKWQAYAGDVERSAGRDRSGPRTVNELCPAGPGGCAILCHNERNFSGCTMHPERKGWIYDGKS